jgi:hypothetical protein
MKTLTLERKESSSSSGLTHKTLDSRPSLLKFLTLLTSKDWLSQNWNNLELIIIDLGTRLDLKFQ